MNTMLPGSIKNQDYMSVDWTSQGPFEHSFPPSCKWRDEEKSPAPRPAAAGKAVAAQRGGGLDGWVGFPESRLTHRFRGVGACCVRHFRVARDGVANGLESNMPKWVGARIWGCSRSRSPLWPRKGSAERILALEVSREARACGGGSPGVLDTVVFRCV